MTFSLQSRERIREVRLTFFVLSSLKMMRTSQSVNFGQMSVVVMGSSGVGKIIEMVVLK